MEFSAVRREGFDVTPVSAKHNNIGSAVLPLCSQVASLKTPPSLPLYLLNGGELLAKFSLVSLFF